MAGKQKVTYTKPQEPEFLRKIKEQVGYKEPDTIEAKKQKIYATEDDDEEKDELLVCVALLKLYRPQIVVLKEGDLSEADVDKIHKEHKELEDRAKIEAGQIIFRKPVKRTAEDNNPDKRHCSNIGAL